MKETLGHLIIKPYSRGETQAIKKFNGWFQVENEEHNEKNDNKDLIDLLVESKTISQARLGLFLSRLFSLRHSPFMSQKKIVHKF